MVPGALPALVVIAAACAVADCDPLASLPATGPAPDRAESLALFGRLVGDWDLEVLYYHPEGRVERQGGEWHFGWILGGLAIQDVWRVPASTSPGPLRGYGTTIRLYDPTIDAWRVTWFSVLNLNVTSFLARAEGTDIVMSAQGVTEIFRWVFFDIAANSFRWKAISSSDDGRTWTVEQEISARRATSSPRHGHEPWRNPHDHSAVDGRR